MSEEAPKKKSKVGMILGILAGLFFGALLLCGGVVGGGLWYAKHQADKLSASIEDESATEEATRQAEEAAKQAEAEMKKAEEEAAKAALRMWKLKGVGRGR